MDLLLRLAQDAPSVVSRQTLLDDVWSSTYVTDDAVSAAVIKLRRAFDDDARTPTVVETLPKSGYRLVGSVAHGGDRGAVDTPKQPELVGSRIATVVRCSVELGPPGASADHPEAWLDAMQAAVTAVTAVVERFDGWLYEESTGMLAVFGAPVAQEHHRERACSAAAELLTGPASESAHRLGIRLRLGIASGPVVVSRRTGGGSTVYGEPTIVASTLAAAADHGEALVMTFPMAERQLAEGAILEPCTVPGVEGDVRRLVGVAPPMGLWGVRSRQGLTPLQGRAEELDRLEGLLKRVASGRGQVVTVSGEPGVGKSRLLFEFVQRAASQGIPSYVGQSSPVHRHSPYVSWSGLMRAARPLVDRALERDSSDPVALNAVLSPATVDRGWTESDPEARQERTVEAVMDALLTGDQPTVLALEDFHWADEASRTLAEVIAGRIARRSCLLVITARPSQLDPFAHLSYASRLWLDSLGPSQASALLESLVGSDPSIASWRAAVLRDAGGTPLFLEECVRSSPTNGTLIDASKGPVAGSAAVATVPISVQSLIADRLDRLSESEQAMICAAAVLGHDIPEQILRSVVALDDAAWRHGLANLQREELLYLTTDGGRRALVFKHALTREVALRGIRTAELRSLHERSAHAISATEGVSAEALAWHLQESHQSAAAIEKWLLAAESAAQAGGFQDALADLAQARTQLPLVHDGPQRLHLSLAVELAVGTALVQTLGPTDTQVEDCYERARGLAGLVGSPDERFQAAWGSWFVQMMRGDLRREREFGQMVATASETVDDSALALEAHHVQWSGLTLAGDPRLAMAHSDAGIDRYDKELHHRLTFSYGGHDPGVCARNLNALARLMVADIATARERSASAVALATELAHAYSKLESTQSVLVIALLERDSTTLTTEAERLLRLVDDGRLPEVTKGYAHGFFAAALAIQGMVGPATTKMLRAAPVWSEFWGAWCFPLDGALAQVLSGAGEQAAAIRHLEQTLSRASESGGHWWDAELTRLLATVRHRSDSDSRAAAVLCGEAADIAFEQGALLLELRAATSCVELSADSTDRGHARRRLADVAARVPDQPPFPDLVRARRLLDA
jgi:hypothetical protein